MKEMLVQMILLQVIVVIVFSFAFFYLIRFRKLFEFHKRIAKYAVKSVNTPEYSLGDRIKYRINKYLRKIQSLLSISKYFKNYSKKYHKYLFVKNNNEEIDEFYIISIKIFISIIFGILYLISSLINYDFKFLFFIICLLAGFFLYDLILIVKYNKRRKLIENDLLNALVIMNNSFKAGYNITQAIDIVVNDLNGPIKEEFIKIKYDINYGLDLADVFDNFYNRVKIEDAKYITSSLSLLNLTGGNLIGIFNSIETTFTNKKRLKDELSALTGSSLMIYRVLVSMPFILILIITVVSPAYFNPLFTTSLGLFIIFIIFILLVIYIYTIKKILRIDI